MVGRPRRVEVEVGDARELHLAAAREARAVPGQRRGRCLRRLPRAARSRPQLPRGPGSCAPGCARTPPPPQPAPGPPVRRRSRAASAGRACMSPSSIHPAAPQGERRDAQGVGDPVHLHLRGELDLGGPEPPECAIGGRVRGHGPPPDAHIGAAIGAAGMEHAARQHHRREGAVGAAVHDDVDVLGHEGAVAQHAGAVADDRRDGAWWSRRCPRGGRRSCAPGARTCAPAAPHGPPRSRGTPPCLRSRLRSRSGSTTAWLSLRASARLSAGWT